MKTILRDLELLAECSAILDYRVFMEIKTKNLIVKNPIFQFFLYFEIPHPIWGLACKKKIWGGL
jgi:hypothetical protein